VATTLKGDHSWLPAFCRYTPDIFILHHFLRLVDYPRFLRYLIRSRQADAVLISNSRLGYLLLPYLRAHYPEVTFLDVCHAEVEYVNNGGYPRLSVEYQELIDLNIVVSNHLKNWMHGRGADPQRIGVCTINVDVDKWRPDLEQKRAIRQELAIARDVPVILYAGRICNERPPHVLARTLLRLSQDNMEFIALIAGDGPDLPWLRTFVQQHKLTHQVRLLGTLPNESVLGLMRAADVFFLPSRWEGIALAIYEAMACGLPVVGADVGGQRELVTPECGVLLERCDEETQAQQYARILGELLRDPERRQTMGQAGRIRVSQHFTIEQMGEQIVTLLKQAKQLHDIQDRPIPGLGLARACAMQAVEYTRLSLLGQPSHSNRKLVYLAIRELLLPYYRMAQEHNMQWLVSLKERLTRLLV
jgi:glycosyltransferase involved in cell wall biosynthesis